MSARTQKQGAEAARELVPGQSAELLKALHILTREGNLNADSLRKLKQVNHLARLLRPAVEDVLGRFGEPVVVDCGAGKSYLGFVLYELFLGPAGKGTLHAVESRPELVAKARDLAARLGFERMAFEEATIAAAAPPARVHLVTALHACDTATDEALALAVRPGADHVAVVPFCQAEVARQLAYGEQKAVEIARALATEPQLVLLDEPAAGLNASETGTLMALVRRIRDLGKTVLLIEHDMRMVMEISDRVAVLDHGRKIAEGLPAEVRADRAVIASYLGEEAADAAPAG